MARMRPSMLSRSKSHAYQREVARWIGVDLEELDGAVREAARQPVERRREEVQAASADPEDQPKPQVELPDYTNDAAARRERQALEGSGTWTRTSSAWRSRRAAAAVG